MDWGDLGKAIVGFLLGLASAYIGLYWKVKKDLEAQYDKDLRSERLKAYVALWKLLQPLAKYARSEPVTPKSLKKLSGDLRQWYFEVGGLFLSAQTRDAYFSLQDELKTKSTADAGQLDRELTDRDFEELRKRGSSLRTATTVDVGSRKKPLIGDEASA
jgi:hypothetical protein